MQVGSGASSAYDATKTAMEVIGKPIVNTAMLGAFAKMTGLVSIESLKQAIGEKFPGKVGELNQQLIEKAYNEFGDE